VRPEEGSYRLAASADFCGGLQAASPAPGTKTTPVSCAIFLRRLEEWAGPADRGNQRMSGHPRIDLRSVNLAQASLSTGERTISMSLIQTCKCEECDMQKSFANHWVMLYQRNGNLVILPKWDEKMIRRTRHFCGRAHASRYVERWIANPTMGAISDGAAGSNPQKAAHPLALPQSLSDAEDEATASELVAR
jgi:hypothetical protein